MAYSISTVALTDTFDTWRQRTNDGITAVNDSTDAATANKLVIRDANGHVSFKNITSANNITIAPDTNGGTATVLTVSGSLESTSTTSGSVTIAGGVGVAKNAYIGNSVFVTNTATISGNTVVGSAAASDKVTFNSRVATDFDPITNQTHSLGDASLQWANTHTRKLFVTADASTAATAVTMNLDEDTNIGVDIDAEMTTANVVQIDASALTYGNAFVVRHIGDALTANATHRGSIAYFHDSSNDANARDDVKIYQDDASATLTTALNVQSVGGGLNANGAVFINHDLTGASNTFVVDTETQTGHGMYVMSDVLTTGITAFLGHSGTNTTTTTGKILKVVDNSSVNQARNVAEIVQDHASAASATALLIQADGGGGIKIDDNTNTSTYPSLWVDSEKTSVASITYDLAATTVGDPSTGHVGAIDINFEALTDGVGMSMTDSGATTTTGTLLKVADTSAQTGTRSVVSIVQDNTSATGATALKIKSDAGKGLWIDSNLAAGGASVTIDGAQETTNTFVMNASTTTGTIFQVTADAVTTGKVIDITADALTTGSAINIVDNSPSTTGRKIVSIHQDHASSNAVALYLKGDSTVAATKILDVANSSASVIYATTDGDVIIPGDLTVQGATTEIGTKTVVTQDKDIVLGTVAEVLTDVTFTSASPSIFAKASHGLANSDYVIVHSITNTAGATNESYLGNAARSAICRVYDTAVGGANNFKLEIQMDGPGGSTADGTAVNGDGSNAGKVSISKVTTDSGVDEAGVVVPSTTGRHSLTWDDGTDSWNLTDNLDVGGSYIQIPAASVQDSDDDPTGVGNGSIRYNTHSAVLTPQYYQGTDWNNISSQSFATAIAVALG